MDLSVLSCPFKRPDFEYSELLLQLEEGEDSELELGEDSEANRGVIVQCRLRFLLSTSF